MSDGIIFSIFLYFACSALLPSLDAFFLTTLAPGVSIGGLGKVFDPCYVKLFHSITKYYNSPTMKRMHWSDESSTLILNSPDGITCHWFLHLRDSPWEKQNISGGTSGANHRFGRKWGWWKVLVKSPPQTTNADPWCQSCQEKSI